MPRKHLRILNLIMMRTKFIIWKMDPVDSELKYNTEPICLRTYPVLKIHGEMFKKEAERLVLFWFLEVANDSEWVSRSFAQLKPKSNIVSILNDFRNLNKKLGRKSYTMPTITELLLKWDGFQYAKSVVLNMGYYHIWFIKKASNLCAIILPWWKYC